MTWLNMAPAAQQIRVSITLIRADDVYDASKTNGRTVLHWEGRTGGHGKVYVALHYNAFVLKCLKQGFGKDYS